MRLALTSDLHVDHHPEVVGLIAERVRRLEVDVLVVAGDVSGDPARLEETLARLRAAAPVLFVPGNHDLWIGKDGADSRQRAEEIIPARVKNAGALLPPAVLGGIQFVGVTGWYDYSLRTLELPLENYRRGSFGRLRWNDVDRVIWPGLSIDELCAREVASLKEQLEIPGRKIVVTHHLPFAELLTDFGDTMWEFMNGFMGSRKLGEAILAASDVALVCCGHTHFRKSLVVGGIPVEISPIGYPREIRRSGMDLAARVEERVTLLTEDEPSVTSIDAFRPGSSLGRAAD